MIIQGNDDDVPGDLVMFQAGVVFADTCHIFNDLAFLKRLDVIFT